MSVHRSIHIGFLVAALFLAAPARSQVSFLVINEVDSDTPTAPVNDDHEFIELYDGGIGNQSLVGYSLVFFNGGSTSIGINSYWAIDLTGSTDINGYYVIGNPAVTQALQNFPINTLQNGADAIGLYFGPAAAFPSPAPSPAPNSTNGTPANAPVLATTLVDAVVYHTSDPPANNLIAILTPGQPQVNENANGNSANESIGRCPNGLGGVFTTTGWLTFTPTPGAPNACPTGPIYSMSITQSPPCGGPIVLQVNGAQPNAEIFNLISLQCGMPAGGGPLFGLSVGPTSGDPLSQLFAPLGFAPFHVNTDGIGSYLLSIPTSGICPGVTLSVEAVSIQVTGYTIHSVTPTTGCVALSL